MKKKIFHFITLVCLTFTAPLKAVLTLEQRLASAKAGDFIVTAQEGNYSLLSIQTINTETLLLEEIAVPELQIDLKKIDWKAWVAKKAPGHTSWTLYEINRQNGKLVECFSYSKNGWLYLDESQQFLTQLLTLPLSLIADKDRKKIGPPPLEGEDRRALWNPPLIIEGEKVAKPLFEVVKAQWPKDSTQLSQCFIELYFAKTASPFPYWLEVQSPHYTFKMRAIDSGHGLLSPRIGPIPHRSPQIMGFACKEKNFWKIPIKTPAYFQKLKLFALDLTEDKKSTIPIAFVFQQGAKEEALLEISTADLKHALQDGHRYRWILLPEAGSDFYLESEEIFTWKLLI